MERVAGGEPTEIQTPAPRGTERGRDLAAASGCLACHRIGQTGNVGPGSDLTRVGRRLSADEIERVLIEPEPPTPPYTRMPAADRRELVRYLAALR